MSRLNRRHCAALGLLVSVTALVLVRAGQAAAGAEQKLARFASQQTHMGSSFHLVLYTMDEPTARRASDAAFTRVAQLDDALSDYDPESELMRLCDRAGEGPVAVSDDLYRCLSRALDIARDSDGAFDPTVNPVNRLWRRARRDRKLPDPDLIAKARKLVGYQNVRLNADKRTVELLKPGMKLDLGGIAKGFAAQEAQAVLKAHGIQHAMVAAAGDIVVTGPPPGQDGWRIGIAPLDDPDAPPERLLSLQNTAISTAGDAERFVIIDGKRYGHILDPRTGESLIRHASVTVVAPDGATADGLDTAVFVMGPEAGLALVENTPGAAALYIDRDEHGRIRERATSRWAAIRPATAASGLAPDAANAP